MAGPVAEPFCTRGVGNGFPFCLSKLDVSSYAKWTTFSGVNKDNVNSFSNSALQEKIYESLELGRKLYWNVFALNGDVSASEFSNPSYVSVSTVSIDENTLAYGIGVPKDRVCNSLFWTMRNEDADLGVALARLALFVPVIRMYDDTKFVGYGAGIISSVLTGAFASVNGLGSSRVSLYGYTNLTSGTTGSLFTIVQSDVDYVELSGYSFVALAEARYSSSGSGTANALALSATANTVFVGGTSASLSSLDFYTYP